MTEWEELDPGPTLADRVLVRVRRRQARRIGWTLGLALLVAVTVALPLAWPSRDADPAVGEPARSPVAGSNGGATMQPDTSERAEIYAAALTGLAGPHRPVQVRNEICAGRSAGPAGDCGGELIPAAVVREVERRRPGQVRFVAHPGSPYRTGDPVVVTFGQLHITGPRATLRRDLLCGSLCGQGETLVLRRLNGKWQVTGTQGPEWLS